MHFDRSISPARGGLGWIGALTLVGLAALPLRASARCTGDCNDDRSVEINELIIGVNNALDGCPSDGTPTPSATRGTPTPTATTNTPTVTPTIGGVCGDGFISLELGETCDDGNTIDNDGCPANCHVAACTASGQRLRVNVDFTTTPPTFLQGLTIFLRYPDGTIGIPARDDSPPVRERVTSEIFAVTPRDFDYSLRVLLLDPLLFGYSEGTAMTVDFDVCQGAAPPRLSAITCTIESATDLDFQDVPVDDVQCTLTAAP